MILPGEPYQWGGCRTAPRRKCLNGPYCFIFAPKHNITKIKRFGSFGKNLTWWRHCFIVSYKEIGHNDRLTSANDSILKPEVTIDEGSMSWNFYDNPTWWRHFMTSGVILRIHGKMCRLTHFGTVNIPVKFQLNLSILNFWMTSSLLPRPAPPQ